MKGVLQLLLPGQISQSESQDVGLYRIAHLGHHIDMGEHDVGTLGQRHLCLIVICLAFPVCGGNDEPVQELLHDLAFGEVLYGVGRLVCAPVVRLLDLLPEIVGDIPVPDGDEFVVVRRHFDDVAVMGEFVQRRRHHRDHVVRIDIAEYVGITVVGGIDGGVLRHRGRGHETESVQIVEGHVHVAEQVFDLPLCYGIVDHGGGYVRYGRTPAVSGEEDLHIAGDPFFRDIGFDELHDLVRTQLESFMGPGLADLEVSAELGSVMHPVDRNGQNGFPVDDLGTYADADVVYLGFAFEIRIDLDVREPDITEEGLEIHLADLFRHDPGP